MRSTAKFVVILILGGLNNHPSSKYPEGRNGDEANAAVPLPPTEESPVHDPARKAPYGNIIEELWDRRNGSRPSTPEPFVDSRSIAAIAVQSVTMVIIISGSVIGNALVLSTLCKKRCLQNKTSVFIANLAIADLLNALLSMPFMLISSIIGYWKFNDALCSFSGAMGILMGTTGINTLAAIAYERYSAILHPLKYHDKITHSCIAKLLSWSWIQGFALSMCPIFGWSRYAYLSSEYLCTADWAYEPSYTFSVITVNFVIPFFVMIYCYGHIFRVARRHSRRVAAIDFTTNSKAVLSKSSSFHKTTPWKNKTTTIIALSAQKFKKEAKAATMLMIVMGTFMACWIPQGCTMICMALGDSCVLSLPDAAYTTTTWLAMCASFCNPLVYGVMNRQYREAFHSICWSSLCMCCAVCNKKSLSSSISKSTSDTSDNLKGNSFDDNESFSPNVSNCEFGMDKDSKCQVFVILR